MDPVARWRALGAEYRALALLAGPMIIARVGSMLMGVVDTVMAGLVGRDAVAALGLATTSQFVLIVFAMGTLMGLDPLVSAAVGSDDRGRARQGLVAARWLGLALTVPVAVLLLLTPGFLAAIGQPASLLPMVTDYLQISVLAVLPTLLFQANASYLAAHGDSRFLIGISLAGNALNIVGNGVLVAGWGGLPSMGVAGIAASTVLCACLQWVLTLAAMRPGGSWAHARARWRMPDGHVLLDILRTGLPVGAQYMLECTGFAIATVVIGRLGEVALAGHHIALNVASVPFTAALGISGAAAIRVGLAYGRRDAHAIRRAAVAAWSGGVGLALVAGVGLIVARYSIASTYVDDAETIAVATSLIVVAAAFQLADTAQCIGFGLLRGMDDTRVPATFNFLGYYALGLPLGAWGTLVVWRSPAPMWWGITLALSIVAGLVILRFRWKLRGLVREGTLRLAADPGIQTGSPMAATATP